MNSLPVNASLPTNSSKPTQSSPPLPITTFTRTTYILIAVVAFLGNALVILVFIRQRALLRKSYNVLILALAISDIVISINLITSPAFIFGDSFPYPTGHLSSEIFCRLFWTRTILFQMVVFSTYICLALTVERWYAVVKPLRYSHAFSRKRVLGYIGCAWLLSVLTCLSSALEVAYFPTKPPSRRCSWKIIGNEVRSIAGIIQVLFKMVLPILSMVGLCAHMLYKTQQSSIASAQSKARLRENISRMVGGACLAMIICWTPNQVNYALAVSGKSRLDSPAHHYLTLLTFINSCVNPFIYGFSNKNYRKEYVKILSLLIPRCAACTSNTVANAGSIENQQQSRSAKDSRNTAQMEMYNTD